MGRLKETRTKAFLTCFALGIIFILVYLYSSALVIVDGESADKNNLPPESAGNQELTISADSQDLSVARFAIEGTDGDRKATSRGDVYRAPATEAAATTLKPAAKTAAASVKSATAPKAAVTDKPTAAPKAAPAKPATKQAAAPVKPEAASAPAPKAAVAPAAPKEQAPAKPASGYESDLDLLARLITAEAQGEPYEAQVAVGAVVMNRVKSSDWPNTVKGVIYQEIGGYYQFTPVVNGWIDKPAEQECVKAAKEAMNGADPTGGSQFYYDDKVTNQWILAKPVSVQFGHMIFAY